MKWILYIVLLLGTILVPGEATDVGKLIPVEVVAVSEDHGIVTIETDTGDWGQGQTVAEAVGDMEAHPSGVIYLDTAEYLIVEEGIVPGQLCPWLKGNVRVCAGADIPLQEIAEYLTIHKPRVRLRDAADHTQIQTLREVNGRYKLS